jgi:hypothetical protein
MPTFAVRARFTSPWQDSTVEANSYEEAVHQVIAGAQEGYSVEVSKGADVSWLDNPNNPPGGETGATGASGAVRSSHPSPRHKGEK